MVKRKWFHQIEFVFIAKLFVHDGVHSDRCWKATDEPFELELRLIDKSTPTKRKWLWQTHFTLSLDIFQKSN